MSDEEIADLERVATRWAEMSGDRVVNLVAADLGFVTAMRARGFVYRATRDEDFVDLGFVLVNGTLQHPDVLLPVEEARVKKFAEIDAHTDGFFAQGFTYEGLVFSLSLEAQARFLTLLTTRDFLAYPVQYNSQDDKSKITLNDAGDIVQFIFTALGTARTILDSGTALKQAVRNAETTAEVLAIVDER